MTIWMILIQLVFAFEIYLSGVVDILSPGIGQAFQKYLNLSFDPRGCISKGAVLIVTR